jgi:ABC-type polar amino acid transport system ATPase subunit
MNANPIIRVEHLHKWFGLLHILKDISFTVQSREVLVIIGRSGSGKSTLLRCLNFLEEPSAGTISIAGKSVACGPGIHQDRNQILS